VVIFKLKTNIYRLNDSSDRQCNQPHFPSTIIQQLIPIVAYLPNADALMYSAESLKNHKPGILNKLIQNCNKEKVIEQNHLALVKLLPSTVKVEVDIEMLNKFRNRVPVSVGLLQTQRTRNSFI
jgi:hypothetical protein